MFNSLKCKKYSKINGLDINKQRERGKFMHKFTPSVVKWTIGSIEFCFMS